MSTIRHLRFLFALAVFVSVFCFSSKVFAEEVILNDDVIKDKFQIVGDQSIIEDFVNIQVSSFPSAEITKDVSLGSVILFIPAVNEEKVTVSLENLPNKDLYIYIDSLEDGLQHSKNEVPTATFILTGFESHLIFVRSQHSTKIIRNNTTGGDCTTFGIWDQNSLTCTMTQDIFEVIEIASDGITLDGNGHMVKWNNGFGIGGGVHLSFRRNIIVKNLIVEGFDNGFDILQTRDSSFLNNETRGFGMGFYVAFSSVDNLIDGNKVTNTSDYIPDVNITSSGMYIAAQRTTIRNNTISVTNIGIPVLDKNNQIYNNNFLSVPAIVSSRNAFNTIFQPLPIGGNYYRYYDTNSEGCFDANNDFICDSQIVFNNLTDNFPWIYKNGWKGERVPDLTECCSSVLFLPGLEASRLYKQKTILDFPVEDQLWEPNANSDVVDLYLNIDGTSKNSGIYTRDIIKEANVPIPTGSAAPNVYKSFVNMLDDLVNNFLIADFTLFAYDWRQSVDDIVNNGTKYQDGNVSLVATLQSLVDSSKSGKVTIIAHSNGGLLAKALLKKLQDDKDAGKNNLIDDIDVLILVASPEIGTASALSAILHGYDQSIFGGLLMDETHAREIGRNMISAFGLLPSKEYINRVSLSPATFVDNAIPSNVTTKLVQTFGSAISSYDEYKSFLFGEEGRINPPIEETDLPISLSQSLFLQAESLHDSIDVFIPPASLRVIEVAGWGLDTVASFEYYPITSCSIFNIICKSFLDERPRFTLDGDGVVVVPSAQYMGTDGNAEKYWVDLFNINEDKPLFSKGNNHGNILEVPSLLSLVLNTILKLQLDNSLYLTTTIPVDDSNRLRLSIHSPVTLDAYDIDGNHAGKVCPPSFDFCYKEENITNSSYLEFGEGKYLNLPEDQMFKVKLQGTDVGTFTYDSEKVLPDGTSTTSSFVDIPVTTQTQAEVTLNSNSGAPQLALDVTGDGVMDFTITPNATFDPVLFLQIMEKTVESFDISKQQKNNLLRRIDDTIKAIQKGKINKAKLKIEQFKKALTIHTKENEKDKKEKEKRIEREHEKEHQDKKKPRQLNPADVQTLVILLNQLLDNLN